MLYKEQNGSELLENSLAPSIQEESLWQTVASVV